MPNKHKNPMLGWHPESAELGVWVRAEAERRGVPYKEIIEEAVAEYRQRRRDLSGHEVVHRGGDPANNDIGNIEIRKQVQ